MLDLYDLQSGSRIGSSYASVLLVPRAHALLVGTVRPGSETPGDKATSIT
jgi:hypothetical protein